MNDISKSKIVISRDSDCPYRIATLEYIKRHQLSVDLIEVDTMSILIAMIEHSDVMAILPEKVLTLSSKLQTKGELENSWIYIYVYPRKDNIIELPLDIL